MATLEDLVDNYPGDDAWKRLVDCYAEGDRWFNNKDGLVAALGDMECAIVIVGLLGDGALSWIETDIPALAGRKPRDILKLHPDGKIMLRSLLMQMPS